MIKLTYYHQRQKAVRWQIEKYHAWTSWANLALFLHVVKGNQEIFDIFSVKNDVYNFTSAYYSCVGEKRAKAS